jgi:mitogen-activated protein kinase kinase 7
MSNLNLNLTPNSRRRPIPLLPIPTLQQRSQKNFESEKRLRALKTNALRINGIHYETNTQDLEYLSELGNGTSGHVVKMLHKPSGAVIAVKQMRRTGNDEETKRITMDLEVVLKSHDCPFIVQCLGCFITEADVWICMELMSTCFDKLQKRTKKSIPETILRHVTEATVKALFYLKNKHGVIHR